MVFQHHIIYSPERKHSIISILLHHARLVWSSLSLPMLSLPSLSTDCLSFLFPGGPGRPLTPFPQADPISLGSQATARFYVGHLYVLVVIPSTCICIHFCVRRDPPNVMLWLSQTGLPLRSKVGQTGQPLWNPGSS